jgi:pimeloyl-ACP methyl ester carboxylesterase
MAKKIKKDTDLQGITRIVTDATLGVTEVVEAMHHRIVHPPFLPSTPIQHLITAIAGITFKNIKWGTKFIGGSLDKALKQLGPILGELKTTNQREAIRAALNGVVGDYLEAKENPLQITMQFRYQGLAIPLDRKGIIQTYPAITGKILVMVHGCCMNDIQWTQKTHNHGEALADSLHTTPIYLQYNSGRHVSTNGQDFNELLENLVLQWPVPVEELVILAHSMGGLLTRSALHYGQQTKKTWTNHLKKIVFLGTPHHGSPLEQAGNYLDAVLTIIPYTKPFARLGKIRSAGVTDLRYGNLIDEDWQGNDRFERQKDKRKHIPLPKHIDCFSIAGDTGSETDSTPSLLGDRLVHVNSALGQHKNPTRNLHFRKENTWIAYENTHLDLLSDAKVYTKIKGWLAN